MEVLARSLRTGSKRSSEVAIEHRLMTPRRISHFLSLTIKILYFDPTSYCCQDVIFFNLKF
jgi:hypothetical protein